LRRCFFIHTLDEPAHQISADQARHETRDDDEIGSLSAVRGVRRE
jgi:hypothetical protein